jgi:hypothetical protein
MHIFSQSNLEVKRFLFLYQHDANENCVSYHAQAIVSIIQAIMALGGLKRLVPTYLVISYQLSDINLQA